MDFFELLKWGLFNGLQNDFGLLIQILSWLLIIPAALAVISGLYKLFKLTGKFVKWCFKR